MVGLSLDETPLLLFDCSEIYLEADTVELAVLAMIDHSRFIHIPSPDKIIESRILSSSGDNGIKVPNTIDSLSGDDSTTCSGLVHHCNRAKFPLPKYTICRSAFFNMSPCEYKSMSLLDYCITLPYLGAPRHVFPQANINLIMKVHHLCIHPGCRLANCLKSILYVLDM